RNVASTYSRDKKARQTADREGCMKILYVEDNDDNVYMLKNRLSFAPPPCRMPLGQSQCIPQADPRGMATPWFWHRLIGFRHVISGSLALASLNHTCRNLVPTFPQRSPPSLLTTAACGGLRSTPDCRPRRAFLHLSYSYA